MIDSTVDEWGVRNRATAQSETSRDGQQLHLALASCVARSNAIRSSRSS